MPVLPLLVTASWLAIATGPSSDSPAAAPAQPLEITTYDDDPLGVQRLELPNGLTVLLSENHERPEVFGAVVVRTGGKNDPPDNTGMAHYLEHMLFKGTTDLGTLDWEAERPLQERLEGLYDQLATAEGEERDRVLEQISSTVKQTYAYTVPNELDQMLEEIGGTGVNAFTTYDETVYHNTFPASQIDSWLAIYAHRFEDPVFRLFPTELEAVYEEKNIAIDTTGYSLFRDFMKAAFPGHPYGTNDILGEVEHLKRPSLTAMRDYFERYYVPGNMALVLSGDFDTATILPIIEAEFGGWKAGPDPKPPQPPVRPFEVDERLRMRATPVRVGALAFRTVPESHPDFAALQVARKLLSNEQRSGFIDRLSDDGKLMFAVHVPADLADHNLDVIVYLPRIVTQSFRGAENKVLEQLGRLREGDFDDATFEALKEGLLVQQTARWEDNRERALAIGHAFVTHGEWGGQVRYLQGLRTLTKDDVRRVAGELFGDRKLVVRSRMGFPGKTRLDKPKTPPVEPPRGKHSEFFQQMRERPKRAPEIQLVDPMSDQSTIFVREGVTLEVVENPFNELYQLELQFGIGRDALRELDILDDYLTRIGTRSIPAEELRQRFFSLSTTLSVEAHADRFVVRLAGPQGHMNEALDLVADLMRAPSGKAKPLRQLRREVWGFRRLERKDPPNVGRALRDHVMYGDDSPKLREHGPWGARGMSVTRLLSAWEQVQQRELKVRYVGNADAKQVAEVVRIKVPLAETLRPAKPRVVHARTKLEETTVFFVPRRDAVQTQLWFWVEGDPIARSEVPKADAFGEYFGGSMAGLVFQEVREFRALAYAAQGYYLRDPNLEQRGYLLSYVGCQADKTFEALDVMVGLITAMPQRPARLEMVKSSLVRSQETASPEFRELSQTIEDWRLLGYGNDPRRWQQPAYESLQFDDIAQFYRDHVKDRPVAIMVVGDPRKVKPATLATYGKLVRVRESSLFSH